LSGEEADLVLIRLAELRRLRVPCADITEATAAGYTLLSADARRAIRVVVTTRNRLGQTPATSAATALVRGVPNPPPPTTGGLHVVGNELRDAAKQPRVPPLGHLLRGRIRVYPGLGDLRRAERRRDDQRNALVELERRPPRLNEDCILAINGVRRRNYMNAIVVYVNKLHAHGLYA
jgi:hypothetical protein